MVARCLCLHCSPLGGLVAGLFVVEGLLFGFDRFSWLIFNYHHKGWAVLIAMAVVLSVVALIAAWAAVAILRRRMRFGVRSLLALRSRRRAGVRLAGV